MTTEPQRGGVGEWVLVPREPTQEILWAMTRARYGYEHGGSAGSYDALMYFDGSIRSSVNARPDPACRQEYFALVFALVAASPVKVESGEAELILSHLELWRNRAATSRKWERGTEVDLLSNLLDKLEAALSTRRPDDRVRCDHDWVDDRPGYTERCTVCGATRDYDGSTDDGRDFTPPYEP